MKQRLNTLLAAVLTLSAGAGHAGTSSGSFNTNMAIASGCEVAALDMTSVYPGGVALGGVPTTVYYGNAWLNVSCSNDVTASLGVGGGNYFNMAGYDQPAMADGNGDYVAYRVSVGGVTVGDAGLAGIAPGYTESNNLAAALLGQYAAGTGGGSLMFDINIDVDHLAVGTYTDTLQLVVAWP